MQFTVIS